MEAHAVGQPEKRKRVVNLTELAELIEKFKHCWFETAEKEKKGIAEIQRDLTLLTRMVNKDPAQKNVLAEKGFDLDTIRRDFNHYGDRVLLLKSHAIRKLQKPISEADQGKLNKINAQYYAQYYAVRSFIEILKNLNNNDHKSSFSLNGFSPLTILRLSPPIVLAPKAPEPGEGEEEGAEPPDQVRKEGEGELPKPWPEEQVEGEPPLPTVRPRARSYSG